MNIGSEAFREASVSELAKRAGWGVRGRLLLAFLLVSMFSLAAAVTGIYSLSQVGRALDDITEQRVPEALAWLELSRSTEGVIRVAPALLAATSEDERAAISSDMFDQMEALSELLVNARTYSQRAGQETFLLDGAIDVNAAADRAVVLVDRINKNFVSIDEFVKQRLELIEKKYQVLSSLARGNSNAQRILSPSARALNFQLSDWAENSAAVAGSEISPKQADLARSIISLLPEQRAAVLFDAFNREMLLVVDAETSERVDLLAFPIPQRLAELAVLIDQLPVRAGRRLAKQLEKISKLSSGPEGLPALRKDELAAIAKAEELLGLNTRLNAFLSNRIQTLVTAANVRIELANENAVATRAQNSNILFAVVALSIVSSLLIVWLYVGRNMTARLTALSDSMMAISDGDLRAALPSSKGGDEISRMAKALVVFRDTAIEVEESNLRQVAIARQRLVDAIESINEGFAFYDSDDQLVLCNARYRDLLFDDLDIDLTPGRPFEAIMRDSVELGTVQEAIAEPEVWLAERLAQHYNPGEPRLQRHSDNKWLLVSERKIAGGGSAAIYSDLTELKQREEELSHANQQILASVHYASRIQSAMLPSRRALETVLPENFLIWEPRDIVGGDFYWCHATDDGVFVILGDCTGHGVPGAFMTLIACGLLDRHLRTQPDISPAGLLAALHQDLQQVLGQDETDGATDDGLEAGVCFIEASGRVATFAGARFSLFQHDGDTVQEIKGDKAGIGYRRYDANTKFTDHTVDVAETDSFYITTDGLVDQVGGPKGRGFGKRRLRHFIDTHHDKAMKHQGEALRATLAEFQAGQYRRDDLAVLGFRITPTKERER